MSNLWDTLKKLDDDDIQIEETIQEEIISEGEVDPASSSEIIKVLNELVVVEMTGINQYLANKSLYQNLQLTKLVEYIDERLADEYGHHKSLLDRIRYLRGKVEVNETLNKINLGDTVSDTFKFDAMSEKDGIALYNKAIETAVKLKDNGSRALFESILKDEEDHLDDLGAKLDQIELMGLQVFLGAQLNS